MAAMRVLLVEADTMLRETLEISLLLEGFDVDAVASLASSVSGSRSPYDAVILDAGADVMEVKQAHPNQHVLMVGGDHLPRTTNTMHVQRPVSVDEVLRWLDSLQVASLLPA